MWSRFSAEVRFSCSQDSFARQERFRMNTNTPAQTSFHMSPEDFRKQGHVVIDWIADYYQRIESFPVLSQVNPGDVRAMLPKEAPAQSEPFEEILADIERVILP